MRKQLPLLVLLLLPLLALAQTVTVPKNVYFADVHLKISDGAQQEIQKKVDALHRNQTYFKIKVDLANAYFPIIERVFKEEGVPDDFKYLALQESGLIGDAVSTSNAVGYWQFKREAASDFNLRMDNVVDERRHIIEASRGAALYFKRSNKNYDNWFTSLLSYYLGYSGVKTYSKPSDVGAKKMEVTEKSHPYVLTFLAHKIAYDNFVGKEKPTVALRELRATPGQSLTDIALATKTDYAELEKYNKWLLGNTIPSGKDYYVMVPVRTGENIALASAAKDDVPANKSAANAKQAIAAATVVKRNGLNALIARPNDTKDKLALQAGISTRKFLKYNDLHTFDEIIAGTAYYIEPKNTTADAEYHVVQAGENMQQISQHYGIRLNYLRYKNRMSKNEVAVPGRVLWLQKRRPAYTSIEIKQAGDNTQSIAKNDTQKQSVVKEKPAKAEETATEEDEPKDNFFKRFFSSFKKDKTTATSQAEEPAVVVQTTANATAKAEDSEEEPEPIEEEELVEETVVAQPKGALYPSSKDKLVAKPKAQNPAATKTEAKPQAETKPVAKPAEKPAAAVKQQEEDEEVEMVLYQEKEETTKTPATKPGTTAAKPQPKTTPAEAPAVKSAKHVVAKGESLYAISKRYNVTVDQLTAWNNLSGTALQLGQELIIAEPLGAAEVTTKAPVQETTAETHTVVAGETLYQISKRYGVTVDELRTWNNLPDSNLKLGMELRVSAPKTTTTKPAEPRAAETKVSTTTETVYHTVESGESMYQISRKYGVTIKDVMEWNNKSDFNVKPGEKLLIRKK